MSRNAITKIFNNQTKIEGVTFKGEDVYVSPFHFSDTPRLTGIIIDFGQSIDAILKSVQFKVREIPALEDGQEPTYERTNEMIFSAEFVQNVANELGKNIQSCCKLISLYTKIPFEDLMNQEYDLDYKKALAIIIGIIQENYSFFTEFISPKIKEMKAEYTNQSQHAKD